MAWGTDLLGGRGHFETSARYREAGQDPDECAALRQGRAGMAADRKRSCRQTRSPTRLTPGVINSGASSAPSIAEPPAPSTAIPSIQPGVLSPLVHGTPTGTTNLESGGDGGYVKYGTFRSEVDMKDWFGRFSYDVTDNDQRLCPGRLGGSRQQVELDQLGGEPVGQPPQHAVRQQSVPGSGDASSSSARTSSAARPPLPAGAACRRPGDFSADREPRPRRRPQRRTSRRHPTSGTTSTERMSKARTACTSPKATSVT